MRWEFEPWMSMGLTLLNLHLRRWTDFPNLTMTISDHNLRSPYLWILDQPSVSVPLSQFLLFQWCAALLSPSPRQPFAFLKRVLIFLPLWSTNLNFFQFFFQFFLLPSPFFLHLTPNFVVFLSSKFLLFLLCFTSSLSKSLSVSVCIRFFLFPDPLLSPSSLCLLLSLLK